jgi:hypothetical protein
LGVELEGAELKEFLKWADKKLGDVLAYTDVDDATVITTHFTRGGNAIHTDGSPASRSDKFWAAGGALLPVVSGGTAKKIVDAASDKVVDVFKNRVKLRKGTKEEIRNAAPKTKDGRYIDPNTQKPIDSGEEVFGHKTGEEWSTYKKHPDNQGKTRKEVINDQNDPKKYQVEDRKSNASHKYEEKKQKN